MNSLIEDFFRDETEVATWLIWKMSLKANGIEVLGDDSGFADTKKLTPAEARQAVGRCTVKACCVEEEEEMDDSSNSVETATVEVVSKEMSVSEWKTRFGELVNTPPIDQILTTEDGSPIRLEIELAPNRPPLIYTRVYVPNTVCGKLGWFAQSIKVRTGFGWKMILMPKARDETIKRLGLDKSVVGVSKVKIIKASASGRSLLGEIAEW